MNSDRRDWLYRHYVANSLRALPMGQHIIATLDEWLNPPPVDTRTPEEIAQDVIQMAGLKWR